MKKTIIASAVAAAVSAPAAFADVKIGGMVNPEFSDSNATTGYAASVNTDLVFTGSEDLGNGLKASFKYHLFHDDGNSTTLSTSTATINNVGTATTIANSQTVVSSASVANNVADLSVSLSGDFGTITAGRFETFNMAYFHPKADMDPSHDITLEDTMGQQDRVNGSLAYVSPSFNGLSVGVSTLMGAGMADAGADTSNQDGSEIMVKYTNAGLELAAGKTTHKGAAADEEVTNVYAGYNMGDLKVGVLHRDVENDNGVAATDNKSTTFNVAYTMGANTVSFGLLDSDDARDGDSVIALKHAMSKNVSAYIAQKNDDDGDDTTLIGVKYGF
jgi:predicted porin